MSPAYQGARVDEKFFFLVPTSNNPLEVCIQLGLESAAGACICQDRLALLSNHSIAQPSLGRNVCQRTGSNTSTNMYLARLILHGNAAK